MIRLGKVTNQSLVISGLEIDGNEFSGTDKTELFYVRDGAFDLEYIDITNNKGPLNFLSLEGVSTGL